MMTPNPETVEEPLHSVHLVKMAEESWASSTGIPRGRQSSKSATSSRNRLPLKVTPYQKGIPDWESPRKIKVNDIVKHFEHLNKTKDLDDKYRNESRSSGIVSDFEEDHDQSWTTFSRSPTPRNSQDYEDEKNDDVESATESATESYIGTPTTRRTPIPSPRSSLISNVMMKNQDAIWDNDDENDDDKEEIDDEEDTSWPAEIEYGAEINNNDYNYDPYVSNGEQKSSLTSKLFSFSVFLFLAGSGGYGAFLLEQRISLFRNMEEFDESMSSHTEDVPTYSEVLPLIVTIISLKFLGWYFIFRKSLQNSYPGIVTNIMLVLFQPALYLISGLFSKPETNKEEDYRLSEDEPYSESVSSINPEDSGFLEDNDDDDFDQEEPAATFSFDSAIRDDNNADETNNDGPNNGRFIIWLSLLQIASITIPILLFPTYLPGLSVSLFESFLIFGQLSQFVIFVILWPILTILTRRRAHKARMD